MGKKSKAKSTPTAAVESAQATLDPNVVEVVQEQVKNQNKDALADGFAQSSAFFGKKSSQALEVVEKETGIIKTVDDKKITKNKSKKDEKQKEQKTVQNGEEKAVEIGVKKKKSKKKKKKEESQGEGEGEREGETTHDDPKARRTIFVGNVSLDATQKDIKSHFSGCGKVENVRLRHLPIAGCAVDEAGNQKLMMKVCANKKILTTAKDNCNAYVTFAEEKSVEAALKLNGSTLANKKIRVDRSDPVIDARRSVFIGNVPFKCTDEQMLQFFLKRLKTDEEPEPIDNVRLIRDRESGLGKGFGYLLLKTPALVAKTLTLRNLKMESRELRVQVCGKRFKNLRGEETAKEKHEGLRASAGARARIHLKRKSDGNADRLVVTKKLKREATAAGLGKKLKPKHAARKAAKAASSSKLSKKPKVRSSSKVQKRQIIKPKHAARKATKI
ncbi:rna recognition motif-containing family protein [Plasmopara halstedii]|uniref:Rna recognition motif-containing family protein n=1 Tax=Plasmopara halstedii TaxID=4781 RepID=A0A0P1AE95_PLAHL|nr:rna recognition motif-containing family protein [Plasmopara halstedii]CEG38888.1 rna recognition motif-containing family protein [Plasmopara halstedii]|eukprot:XP_024575257.1 rna recognition motif-containing family protein [Plasmopara halstedii]